MSALPDDPLLADAAKALLVGKHSGMVLDADWQEVFISPELRLMLDYEPELPIPWMGTRFVDMLLTLGGGPNTIEMAKQSARGLGPMMLADVGRAGVMERVDPRVLDAFDDLEPVPDAVWSYDTSTAGTIGRSETNVTAVRLRNDSGGRAGIMTITKPAVSSTTIFIQVASTAPALLDRMLLVTFPARRPTAILFTDLEGSSPLARRLPTDRYFALSQSLLRAADDAVIDAGGLVGRHAGDGIAAFFLAEQTGSESDAARACIAAARTVRHTLRDVAAENDLDPEDVVLRMGLHWAATPFVGNLTTAGRSEVTAYGDEVNEAARIEACATGGHILASKNLIERLNPDHAAALDLDLSDINYTALAELPQASEKARRDAPAVSVCEI